MKILFLLKKNLIYGSYNSVIAKSGLLNSAQITSNQLEKHLKVKTDIEICVDGNEVDKFVARHKPHCVIIEALWVTPKKMRELSKLHPRVVFVVLVHSETPFLAGEGNAVEWIRKYNDIETVYPCFNSRTTYEQFKALGVVTWYLPNIYHDVSRINVNERQSGVMNIGCFGAIRPFKNQLIQGMAALVFAEKHKKILHFHMNTTRTEQGGESVLKNLISLFEGSKHRLVEHGWKERHKFLDLVSKMDIGMQVSFTESFNIVSADFVHENIPIVVSKTIHWMPERAMVDCEDVKDMIDGMEYAYHYRRRSATRNIAALTTYNKESLKAWKLFITMKLV